MKSQPNILAFSLILIGSVFMLENVLPLRVLPLLTTLWPLIIIVLGLYVQGTTQKRGAGIVLILLGLLLQIDALHLIPFTIWKLWPILLIALGLLMLLPQRWTSHRDHTTPTKPETRKDHAVQNITLVGQLNTQINTQQFTGGVILVLFGTVHLDLTQAKLKRKQEHLRIGVLFGDVHIALPKSMQPVFHVLPLFSDITGRRKKDTKDTEATSMLYLQGLSLVGDVTVEKK